MTVITGVRRRLGQRGGEAQSPAPVLIAALLGFFMMSLDATAVNVALPAIGQNLGGTTAGLQWVVDGYTLMFAALLISAGAVSDRVGAKRVFASGLGVFVLASAACGLAPGLGFLIGARVIQGSAAAVMLPASLALVRQAFADPARRARAVAVWSSGGAVAIAAGPVLGGLLTSAVSWRAIFFINLPVGVVTLSLLTRAPRSPLRAVPLDLAGQATAVVVLAALTFGVISGGSSGFGKPVVAGSLILSAIAAVCFVAVERLAAHPMVPLSLFRSRAVTTCVAIGFAINASYYGVAFVLSLFSQHVLGESAVLAGLMFLPMTALLAGANLASAKTAARTGHHVPVRAGLLVSALGMLALALASTGTDRGLIVVALIPMGVGLGFALPSLTVVMLEAIPADQAGLAAGVLNSSRQTGGALAVAVFGVLVSRSPGTFASFTSGMRDSMLIAAVLLAGSTAAAFAVLRRHGRAVLRRCAPVSLRCARRGRRSRFRSRRWRTAAAFRPTCA